MPSGKLEDAVILVPVDFDHASRCAVAEAVEYARALRARVILLHVIAPTAFPDGTRLLPPDAADPVDLAEYVSLRARALLDEHFASVLTAGPEVRKEARSGPRVETILHAIDECNAKLVIIGTHGRAGVARLMLGSVAENVLRRSPVPVMVVRATDEASVERPRDRSFTAAAAVSGAVAGAATGALAGPAGAVAGGAIGTVLGALAGSVRARDARRSDARDRELDETIGVTRGSLGTPSETKQPSRAALEEAASEDARRASKPS